MYIVQIEALFNILNNKCILIVHMFINVYKNEVLPRDIKNISILINDKYNTKLSTSCS